MPRRNLLRATQEHHLSSPQRKLLSVIVPMLNEENGFDGFMRRVIALLETTLQPHDLDWEIIVVDDGSTDGTATAILDWSQRDKRIRGIVFSRNFGKEAALTAGLTAAVGDAVIPIDADLQDPPEYIREMTERWLNGAEMVVGVRISRDTHTRMKRFTSALFYYCFNKLASHPIPPDAGDFRLLDRVVVDALLRLPERNRFMKGLFSWVGFKTEYIGFVRDKRHAGQTKWNYRRLLNFALDGITAFSTVPLRIWGGVGVCIAIFAFCYALWIIIRTTLFGDPVQGFPTLMVTVLFLGGLQLLGIGVIGEYLGRLYHESKQRPLYIVHHEINANPQRPRA
jgi:glycosyltransferase involved in cell wall biosynthesis